MTDRPESEDSAARTQAAPAPGARAESPTSPPSPATSTGAIRRPRSRLAFFGSRGGSTAAFLSFFVRNRRHFYYIGCAGVCQAPRQLRFPPLCSVAV